MSAYTFWNEILKSPKFVVAPMVDQSELAWRMLSRKYGAHLCYTPMMHAAVYVRDQTYRKEMFTTCAQDRPLIAQFCCDDPDTFLSAALLIQDQVDAIDLNLGCPQGIAKRGHYGSYLQDEWELIEKILSNAVKQLRVPVTAKIRVFEDVDKTVRYAQMIERTGISVLTCHGRTRDQKGPITGLASWQHIKRVKESVKIPVIANGNILCYQDVFDCIEKTGVDAVMSAEGNLHNPALFANINPSVWQMCHEYLDFVDLYECPLAYVRGHVFKMCRRIFETHYDVRDKLAKAKTLENIREVVNDVQAIFVGHPLDNQIKYWHCQAYLRPMPTNVTNEELIKPSDPVVLACNQKEDTKVLNEETSSLAIKKKLDRKIRKVQRSQNKAKQKQPSLIKIEKYKTCVTCRNPRGAKCDHDSCKNCCKKKVKQEKLICNGHGFWLAKAAIEQQFNESSMTKISPKLNFF